SLSSGLRPALQEYRTTVTVGARLGAIALMTPAAAELVMAPRPHQLLVPWAKTASVRTVAGPMPGGSGPAGSGGALVTAEARTLPSAWMVAVSGWSSSFMASPKTTFAAVGAPLPLMARAFSRPAHFLAAFSASSLASGMGA